MSYGDVYQRVAGVYVLQGNLKGEVNTASNVGGGLGLVLTKSGVNLPFKTLSTSQFEEAANVVSIKDASATVKGVTKLTNQLGGTAALPTVTGLTETGGPTALALAAIPDGKFLKRSGTTVVAEDPAYTPALPNYEPPGFQYDDTTHIYVPAGVYFKTGERFRGQYQTLSSAYWSVASRLTVAPLGTYSAGVSSGILGGLVASSCYTVWMMGNDANSILLLPIIRVKASSYSAPATQINPGDYLTGASNNNDFLTADDQWNNYRLRKWKIEDPATDGSLWTIVDTINATPDVVAVTGDITASLTAGDFLMLVPPAGTACLYLGFIYVNNVSQIVPFNKAGFFTEWKTPISVNANLDGSNFANTSVVAAVPPMVKRVDFYADVVATNARYSMEAHFASGTAGVLKKRYYIYFNANQSGREMATSIGWFMSATSVIRNKYFAWGGSVLPADAGTMVFSEMWE